jgi:hypothetical protein
MGNQKPDTRLNLIVMKRQTLGRGKEVTMKHKTMINSASESDQKAEGPPWPSKPRVNKGQLVLFLPKNQNAEADLGALIKHLIFTLRLVIRALIERTIFTLSLVIAIVVPLLVFAGAVNSLLTFGSIALIYVMGGSLGALIIIKARRMTETTSVVPQASDGYQAGLKSDALGIDEKAA